MGTFFEQPNFKELNTNGFKFPYQLNWENLAGGVNRFILPKQITGVKNNIVLLLTDMFPTGSSNDPIAYYMLKQAIAELKVKNNTIEVCAVENAIPSFAWASSVLKIKCIIRTYQMTNEYWLKRAKDFGAEIELEGTTKKDLQKIIQTHKNKSNFISMFESFAGYHYHYNVTGEWITKAVSGVGNSKVVFTVYPASSGVLSGAGSFVKKSFPYSKTLVVESADLPTFYSGKKGSTNIDGLGSPFIPLCHNIIDTDYAMLVNNEEVLKPLRVFKTFSDKLMSEYSLQSKQIKPICNKISPAAIAGIIGALALSKQLYLSEEDNVVVLSENTTEPFEELLNEQHVQDVDAKHIIEEFFINPKFHHVLDVTGQRQRERLLKKKKDFWVGKMEKSDTLLERMRENDFWTKLF